MHVLHHKPRREGPLGSAPSTVALPFVRLPEPRRLSQFCIREAGSDPIDLEAAEILRTYAYPNNESKRGSPTDKFRRDSFVDSQSGRRRTLACGLVGNECVTAALIEVIELGSSAGRYDGMKLLATSFIASDPRFRRRGFTSDFLDCLCVVGKDLGCPYVGILWARDENSIAYFTRRGFVPAPYTISGPDFWRSVDHIPETSRLSSPLPGEYLGLSRSSSGR